MTRPRGCIKIYMNANVRVHFGRPIGGPPEIDSLRAVGPAVSVSSRLRCRAHKLPDNGQQTRDTYCLIKLSEERKQPKRGHWRELHQVRVGPQYGNQKGGGRGHQATTADDGNGCDNSRAPGVSRRDEQNNGVEIIGRCLASIVCP